jgi:hypothetical protein
MPRLSAAPKPAMPPLEASLVDNASSCWQGNHVGHSFIISPTRSPYLDRGELRFDAS